LGKAENMKKAKKQCLNLTKPLIDSEVDDSKVIVKGSKAKVSNAMYNDDLSDMDFGDNESQSSGSESNASVRISMWNLSTKSGAASSTVSSITCNGDLKPQELINESASLREENEALLLLVTTGDAASVHRMAQQIDDLTKERRPQVHWFVALRCLTRPTRLVLTITRPTPR
jgi:hypothetical protein